LFLCSCRPSLGLLPLPIHLTVDSPINPLIGPTLYPPTKLRHRRPQYLDTYRRRYPYTRVASRRSLQLTEATYSLFPPPTPALLEDLYNPALIYSPPLL